MKYSRIFRLVFLFVLTACMAVFLFACGCSDDDSVLNNVLTGVLGDSFSESDQELIGSLVDGSAYEAYENGEYDDGYYNNNSQLPNGAEVMSLNEVPEDTLNRLIAEGRSYLIGLSTTDSLWTEKWYSGDGISISYKTLKSVDYVGCCMFTDNETMLNDGLYLIYDIHALQAGSSDRDNPGIIMTDQMEFEYYQYVLVSGTSDYDNRTFSFNSSFIEGDHSISFDTYAQGGFDIVFVISKQYMGYYTLNELYNDLINLTEDYCILTGSTI